MRAYQADQYRQAVAQVPALPGEPLPERRMREFTYFFLTRFLRTILDRKDRLSIAVGLEVRVPYCDHRLIVRLQRALADEDLRPAREEPAAGRRE